MQFSVIWSVGWDGWHIEVTVHCSAVRELNMQGCSYLGDGDIGAGELLAVASLLVAEILACPFAAVLALLHPLLMMGNALSIVSTPLGLRCRVNRHVHTPQAGNVFH